MTQFIPILTCLFFSEISSNLRSFGVLPARLAIFCVLIVAIIDVKHDIDRCTLRLV